MSEINVKIRIGPCPLFDLKVCVDLNDNIIALKKAICEIKDHIAMNCMTIMYCGEILNDETRALSTYELFSGATVFVFQKLKREKYEIPEATNCATLQKHAQTFRTLLMCPMIVNLMKALCKPEEIHILLYNNPGLIHDPVALTFFQNPELLMDFDDDEMFKNLILHHPALIDIVLHFPKNEQLLQVIY